MMKKVKLDKFEQEFEKDILKYQPVSSRQREKLEKIIRKANEKKNISLRINAQILELLKQRAEKEGIPYQTFISSILHKFITDQLVEQKSIIRSIQLLKFGS